MNIRLFDGQPTRSVQDVGYEILCQSQITLCNRMKGNKLSLHEAMSPEISSKLFAKFIKILGNLYDPMKIKGMIKPTFTPKVKIEIFQNN